MAIKNNNTSLAYYLLKNYKIDVNKLNNQGKSAILFALKNCDMLLVNFLLENFKIDMNCCNNMVETLIDLALIKDKP